MMMALSVLMPPISREASDTDAVSQWARVAVGSVTTVGVITGFEDNAFRPQNIASRGEAAATIARLLNQLRAVNSMN